MNEKEPNLENKKSKKITRFLPFVLTAVVAGGAGAAGGGASAYKLVKDSANQALDAQGRELSHYKDEYGKLAQKNREAHGIENESLKFLGATIKKGKDGNAELDLMIARGDHNHNHLTPLIYSVPVSLRRSLESLKGSLVQYDNKGSTETVIKVLITDKLGGVITVSARGVDGGWEITTEAYFPPFPPPPQNRGPEPDGKDKPKPFSAGPPKYKV
ncbi:hypothetical protein A2814_03050 [Candidatus Nomurabacteria bacterium RIFCSPHIGHO2_01_FULL_38_19]|uniref:Uncharacterized protein n=1 Tax=Candidatus Nomurabacteria bacterium RIFCSPHIGHO2_01_FULL_38_19 TaxID=1801732 RepID=A0A1F6UU18_9BACT|nr:MAG: hypothetical protein A2814_03050 [Candidatus Nomurabacteria bacterium RIFCSPHIGHO2_01_FULL_38_19]